MSDRIMYEQDFYLWLRKFLGAVSHCLFVDDTA